MPEKKKAKKWPRRGNCGGLWLPEGKKANMWPGRGNSGGRQLSSAHTACISDLYVNLGTLS